MKALMDTGQWVPGPAQTAMYSAGALLAQSEHGAGTSPSHGQQQSDLRPFHYPRSKRVAVTQQGPLWRHPKRTAGEIRDKAQGQRTRL